ncbi:NAP1-related protein 2-like [Carica papaya]|uniref:NAP1-related protein 2-like n=1 Tax=Carica papaya TaxID=3649 RepID=UPI000B8C99AF|nr:NAP1-related protein 2-like [Carica papaya]
MAVPGKGKKPRLDGERDSLFRSIEQLQDVQDELDKMAEEANDKVLEVHRKFTDLSKPLYQKRDELIKSIPEFWLLALLKHPVLGNYLNYEDQKILNYLTSVEMDEFKWEQGRYGYSLIFHFEENPYFEDETLTKTFTFSAKGRAKVAGATINWKEGMGNANGVNIFTRGNKRTLAYEDSFFSFFGEPLEKIAKEFQVEDDEDCDEDDGKHDVEEPDDDDDDGDDAAYDSDYDAFEHSSDDDDHSDD